MTFLRTTLLWIVALPYALVFVGAASNQLVMIVNGGQMPVLIAPQQAAEWGYDDKGLDARHQYLSTDTRLSVLADLFNFKVNIESVGDLLISAGQHTETPCFWIWMTLAVRRLRKIEA